MPEPPTPRTSKPVKKRLAFVDDKESEADKEPESEVEEINQKITQDDDDSEEPEVDEDDDDDEDDDEYNPVSDHLATMFNHFFTNEEGTNIADILTKMTSAIDQNNKILIKMLKK